MEFFSLPECYAVCISNGCFETTCRSHLEGQAVQETALNCFNLDGTNRL